MAMGAICVRREVEMEMEIFFLIEICREFLVLTVQGGAWAVRADQEL
jgi:hypothetical protein